ncbi:MAG: methionyl-tRNA formyltransferase [Chloroflexi bacterium]|nr:methionyl-tRNA formyltransferase [Chloroflexota bacterium]
MSSVDITGVGLLSKIFDVTIRWYSVVARFSLRVVFMGTPEFAVLSLEHLLLNQSEVVAVYTQPDRAAGRGRTPVASPVKRVALDWNLPVVQPVNFKASETVAQLAGFHPDVIVVAAFGQILPRAVLDIPPYRCINIHPSLLPKFRGASPIAAAILAGDEFTGTSIMLMERGLDTGPVLARAQIPISPQDSTGSLTAKLSLISAHLLLEVLAGWSRGELAPQPQDDAAATYSGEISKESGSIDWHLPAVAIWRQVRAFNPWPGSFTNWQGQPLKILEAVPLPVPAGEPLEVGQVVAFSGGVAEVGVSTGDGILGILKVQMAGKRVMSAAEFIRGQRHFVGSVLASN